MKRIFLILFAFATICSARQITTSNYTNTPYRERMKSSVSSAILIGVPGTGTAADTCVGTYIYSFQMHQFPVEKSGFYLLYEDVLGGTSYTRRTDWSTISGKYVTGADAVYRNRAITNYGSLLKAAQNDRGSGGTFYLPGTIYGEPGGNESMMDTSLYVSSNQTYNMYGYKVTWSDNSYYDAHPWDWNPPEYGNVLFNATNDSNITIMGGVYYGRADSNYVTGTVHGKLSSDTLVSLYTPSNTFAADSLIKWFVLITSGTGSGQSMRIVSNSATAGDTTLCIVTDNAATMSGWGTKPDGNSYYLLTPMDEFQACVDFAQCHNVHLKDMYIYDFPGDGMVFSGGDHILIEGCTILNPLKWFYHASGNYQNLVGRQGISFTGNGTIHDQSTRTAVTVYDTLRDVKITNCKIIGGSPGGLDIEPNGKMYIENLEISNCDIYGTSTGVTLYTNDSTIVKNLVISNCNISTAAGYGIYVYNHVAAKTDSTTITEALTVGEFQIDVTDTSIFSVNEYVMISDEILRVYSKDATSITVYNNGSIRTVYRGTAQEHLSGASIYTMTGNGRDYGYIENMKILNNTIKSTSGGTSGYGILTQGGGVRNMVISGNTIEGFMRGLELTAGTVGLTISGNKISNNGVGSFLSNTLYPGAYKFHDVHIYDNVFKDNGVKTDSSGSQFYIAGTNRLIVKNNTMVCSNDSTIKYGIYLLYCDSVLAVDNFSYGHKIDDLFYYGLTNYNVSNNRAGFRITSSGSGDDSGMTDAVYDFGTSLPGDSTDTEKAETKRTVLRFNGFRDSWPNTTGAKIVAQNIAYPGYGGDPWRVQTTHLLFYTLNEFAYSNDDSKLRMMITGSGVGLADSSYIVFFDKNSASTTDSDSLWEDIGTNGYGFWDNSGVLKAKNSGGSWTKLLAFIGAKNNNYQAAVGDVWFSSKRDTLWYKASADTSFYLLTDGNVVGKH